MAAAVESSKYLKRQVTYGDLEADFDETALVVHYEIEATAMDDYGNATHSETKQFQKKIHVNSLGENTNIMLLAEEILDRCEFIHESKLPQVVDLLHALQAHGIKRSHAADSAKDMTRQAIRRVKHEQKKAELARRAKQQQREKSQEVAVMANIDDYLEKLYDDSVEGKVKGTQLILQLSQKVVNLESLISNDVLMGAISRVLKEEYKKSPELTINILQVFMNFSMFSQMHPTIIGYRIGDMTMKAIDWESKRYNARMSELTRLRKLAAAQATGDPEVERKMREEDEEESKRMLAEASAVAHAEAKARKKKDKKATRPEVVKQRKALPTSKVKIEVYNNKMKLFLKKQERLLYVCFAILLNLAEDIQIERKMCKRGIVGYLVPMLDRPNPGLLLLVVNFLRKLSIFEENMKEMTTMNVVEKLVKFVPNNQEQLLRAVLRLLFNLSFEPKLRSTMMECSLLTKLVPLLKLPAFRAITLRLMYHISMDDKAKSEFTYTEAIPLVMQLMIHFPEQMLPKELVALGINLSHNARNAELMAGNGGLSRLVTRVSKTHDPLLMKVVRNISSWTHSLQDNLAKDAEYREEGLWAPFVRFLYSFACQAKTPDLLVEILGTLANLTQRDLPKDQPFAKLLAEFHMVELFGQLMTPGFGEDDIILEVIMVIGQVASDGEAARMIAESLVVRTMSNLLAEKATDAEIVLQTLFTMWQLMHWEVGANAIIYSTDAVESMCAYMLAKNPQVGRMAESCLDIVLDYDTTHGNGTLADRVKQTRFERYNQVWLKMLEQEAEEGKVWHEDESEESASYDDGGEWGAMHMNHEAVAVDMGMLGYADDSGQWSDNGDSPHRGGGAGGGAGAADGHPAQWDASPHEEASWDNMDR